MNEIVLATSGRVAPPCPSGILCRSIVGYHVVGVKRFDDKGQLDSKLWKSIFTRSTARFMFTGLRNTLTASLVAMAIALLLGMIGSFGRLDPHRTVRGTSIVLIELFRATPLVLLIYFAGVCGALAISSSSAPTGMVMALALYNGSVMREVFRAGSSRSAGAARGRARDRFHEGQALRRIRFRKRVRAWSRPSSISVTLLKDSSLGALVLVPAVTISCGAAVRSVVQPQPASGAGSSRMVTWW